jgi:hypothetical protein
MQIALALALLLTATQEDIKALGEKLSKEGITGRLAEAVGTDAGAQAIQEKIEFLLAARISRFERDAVGHFEDYLFTTDAKGDLHLRPERRPDVDALVKKLPLAARAMSGFSRRADEIVRRLGDGPMEKRAKLSWGDPGFRTAFFHRHPAELRELDDAELVQVVRSSEPTIEQLEAIKTYEKAYLKLVTKVEDAATREALAADSSAVFLIGRVVRQTSEGAGAPVGALADEGQISFTVDLAALLADVREGEKLLPLLDFVKDDRARTLLAERMLGLRQEQRRKGEEIMNAVLEDGFTAEGDALRVKEGRYESVDALGAELDGIIAEFEGTNRQDFDRIAERCLDAGVIALFEERAGTYLLQEFRDRVVEELADQVRRQGLETFMRTYLTRQGDLYVVRPERAPRVEAILKRAADIASGK